MCTYFQFFEFFGSIVFFANWRKMSAYCWEKYLLWLQHGIILCTLVATLDWTILEKMPILRGKDLRERYILRWIFSIIRVGEFSLDENTFQSKKQHLNAKFIQLLVKILFSVWHGMWILNRVHFKLPPLNQCQVRTFAKAIVNYKNGWTNLKNLSRLE